MIITNIKELNTEDKQIKINNYKTQIATISNIVARLSVPYDDLSVLLEDSSELDLVNNFFNSITCSDKGIENLLYEIIGYSLFKTAKLNKGFIFKGNGRNGKSKIFRILEALLSNQCSHEHLQQLSGNKSGSKTTIEKLERCTVNIAEDQKQPKYINTSIITRLISGEPISLERKQNISLRPYATMLFSVNEVIDFKEVGLHITDRFVVIPFNNTFTYQNGNCDVGIEHKLCKNNKVLQIIATKAIFAFGRVLKNGKFTIPDNVEAETKRYFMKCNNVLEFCNTFPIATFINKSRYYLEYSRWCSQNNYEALTNSLFGKYVLALGYRAERYSFKGSRDTYYVNPNFTNNRTSGVYLAFTADKNDKIIKSDTDFEDYLWKRIDNEQMSEYREIAVEQEIPPDEQISFN